MHRFSRTASALLIIDIQDRLAAQMHPARLERVLNRTIAAIEGAKALGLPIVVTEQYPKGLGPTLKVLSERIPNFKPIEKLEFSAFVPEAKAQLAGRSSVLLTGMETHICVFQTTRGMVEAGLVPYVAVDAVTSRAEADERVGFELCKSAGGILTSVETVLFDALGKAGGPEFKAISSAVK
jgi:nicotinamidase-related amidase